MPIARPLTATPGRALKGRFRVRGEPNLTTLMLLLASLARGTTVIYADTSAPAPEVAAALALLADLGASPETHDDRWQVSGLGALGLLAPSRGLQFSGAPRLLPLALGLLAPYDFAARFEAGPGLGVPPALIEALRGLGTTVDAVRTGQLPLTLRGARLGMPFVWRAPAAPGDNWVEAMLLAGLGLPGRSRLEGLAVLPEPALRLFRHFGADIVDFADANGLGLTIAGLPKLGARTLAPAGDPDIAALAIVAGLVVPGSDLVVENVPLAAARGGVVTALTEMGARSSSSSGGRRPAKRWSTCGCGIRRCSASPSRQPGWPLPTWRHWRWRRHSRLERPAFPGLVPLIKASDISSLRRRCRSTALPRLSMPAA